LLGAIVTQFEANIGFWNLMNGPWAFIQPHEIGDLAEKAKLVEELKIVAVCTLTLLAVLRKVARDHMLRRLALAVSEFLQKLRFEQLLPALTEHPVPP
jgi:hypothetical protein